MLHKKMWLFVCGVCVTRGAWAGEEQASLQYFITLKGALAPISAKGLSQTPHLAEFMNDETLLNDNNVMIPIDGFVRNKTITKEQLKAFVACADGVLSLNALKNEDLIVLVDLADTLGARELLRDLAYVLAGRINKTAYEDFVKGKGLIIDIMQKLPSTVLEHVLVDKLEPELKKVVDLGRHTGGVTAVCFLDNNRLASASADKTIEIYDLKNPDKAPIELEEHKDRISSLGVLPDDRIVSGSWDKIIRIWNVKETKTPSLELSGHGGKIRALVVASDGTIISSGDADDANKLARDTIRVWRLKDIDAYVAGEKEPMILTDGTRRVGALAIMPGFFVSGSEDGSVRLWDLKDLDAYAEKQKEPLYLGKHQKEVVAATFLADGRPVTASFDNNVCIWNLKNKDQPVTTITTDGLWSLKGLANGKMALGLNNKTIRLWTPYQAWNKDDAIELDGHIKNIYSIDESPDGKLVSGSRDWTVKVWEFYKGLTFEQLIEKKALRLAGANEKGIVSFIKKINMQYLIKEQKRKRDSTKKLVLNAVRQEGRKMKK